MFSKKKEKSIKATHWETFDHKFIVIEVKLTRGKEKQSKAQSCTCI